MQIETTLNREQAERLFEKESALYGCGAFINAPDSGVPLYRIGELFELKMMNWFINGQGTLFMGGKDFGVVGGYDDDDPLFDVVYLPGFLRLVCRHNCRIVGKKLCTSEAGAHLEAIEIARRARLEAQEAEEVRKREERKAKRAASRKVKQESAEQAVCT